MRDVKYRAYWHESKLMTSVDTIEFLYGGTRISDGCSNTGWANDECTLIEFTGLKDSHGNEVYEGDILRCIFEIVEVSGNEANIETMTEDGRVVFEDYGFKVVFAGGEQDDLGSVERTVEEFEVIGNRFESPELMKEEGEGDGTR